MSHRFDVMCGVYMKYTYWTDDLPVVEKYKTLKFFLVLSEMDQEYQVDWFKENRADILYSEFKSYLENYIKNEEYKIDRPHICRERDGCSNHRPYDLFEREFGYIVFKYNAPLESLKWLVRKMDVTELIGLVGKSSDFLIENGIIVLENLTYQGLKYYLQYTHGKLPYLFESPNPHIAKLVASATKIGTQTKRAVRT